MYVHWNLNVVPNLHFFSLNYYTYVSLHFSQLLQTDFMVERDFCFVHCRHMYMYIGKKIRSEIIKNSDVLVDDYTK